MSIEKPESQISPEVRKILRDYCDRKREELGPDWKEIEAKRMAEQTTKVIMPVFEKLMELQRGKKKS